MLVAGHAAADKPRPDNPSEDERALALYEKGSTLLQRGDPAASLAPLEQSMELLASPNTELLIAHALRQLKQTARAVERYTHVREAAKARITAGEARYQPTLDDASRWIAALSPRVADLSVNVTGVDGASQLLVNGRRVAWLAGSSGSVRAARSFEEPGKAHVEVRSPSGQTLATADAELSKGAFKLVTIEVGASPAAGSPDAPGARDATHDDATPSSDDGISPPPVAAWIAGGIGVAGMISFAVAGGIALSRADILEACAPRCDPDDPDLVSARDTGNGAATFANVSVAVGAAGLMTGALLWIFLPDDDEPTSRITLDVGPTSLGVRGRF